MSELTVDELAVRTGASVRTIRYYQSEGLLPAPAREGREARYGDEHVERMAMIGRLQARGLRLSAIADLLGRTPEAATDWLGLGATLARPWSDDQATLLTEAELSERVSGTPAGTLEGLVRTAVVERRADTTPLTYLVASPGLLEVAVSLARLGIDLDAVAGFRRLLQDRLAPAADDLVAAFTDQVSLEHLEAEGPGALATLLEQLRPLTQQAVALLFAHEMERAQRDLLNAALQEAAPDA